MNENFEQMLMQYMNFTAQKQNDMLLHIDALTKISRYDEWQKLVQSSKIDKKLNQFGFRVFSQEDQDGIIEYLCKKLKIEKGAAIEFGCGDGECNNTHYLLIKGWKCCWIDCNEDNIKKIQQHYFNTNYQNSSRLHVINSLVTTENINSLMSVCLEQMNTTDLDILSIDTDWTDYWLLKALSIRPKIIVIEYNSSIPPNLSLVVPKNVPYGWTGNNYFGNSFKAICDVAYDKEYTLVGSNLGGNDLFFVRTDILDKFTNQEHAPMYKFFVNEDLGDYEVKIWPRHLLDNLYEVPKYELCYTKGHNPGLENFQLLGDSENVKI